ncbi:MAG: DUF6514 family protein [Bacillota bacterium]|nr:DUF6514 family protein [Bacillota bacterium]
MKSVVNVYSRSMSDIAGLQQGSEVSYCLLETDFEGRKSYGIQVSEKCKSCCRTDELSDISASESRIRSLLTLLFENAIMIDVWRDIVTDFVAETEL